MQAYDEQELRIQKDVAEMRKLNEETRHYVKKNCYFEVVLIIAAFAAGGAFVRFFSGG